MTHQTSKDAPSSSQLLLKLTEAEALIRQAEKDKLAAKYGFPKETTEVPPLLIDVASVSRLTSLSRRTIWRFASCGRCPQPLKVGGRRLWRRQVILDWINEGCPQVGT